MRKGFVYTLEAVIASSLILSVSIFVIPNTVSEPEPSFEPVEQGMLSLQDRDQLGNSTNEITENIEPYTPKNYNSTARINKINRTRQKINSEQEYELDQGYKKLILWVHSTNSFDVNYRGEDVFSSSSEGYNEVVLSRRSGYLNFTGAPYLTFEVQKQYSKGTVPEADSVISRNLVDGAQREVQVIMWK
ncbi:MAG: hypothetical protein BRC29_02150 [Nanohaloarchaea archaeon SW_7_43_1]|nr:MAG: hypothetical protein BRC29_02150 [Nanohaloarchaea archaeon SW_7_43_1]